MYACPHCDAAINPATEICPYCGADLTNLAATEATPAKKVNIVRAMLFWGAALLGLWLVAWFALPWRLTAPRGEAEKHAEQAISDLRSALAAYRAAQGGFPDSLELLGDRARSAARWAQSAGYELQYKPGAPATDNLIHNFVLQARPGNYGFRNFYCDETGVVRATRENRPATASDPRVKTVP